MKKIYCLFLFIFLCGCAGFREGKISSIKSFPQTTDKASLGISLDFIVNFNGNRITNENAKNKIQSKIVERFNKTGLFSNVVIDSYGEDYTLNIKYEDLGATNLFLAALTGATLYIFPSYAKDTNVITANLINNKTKRSEEIVLNDSVTTWQEILLLPITPFKHPLVEAVSMQNDLIDNLALQTYEKIQSSRN